MKNLSDIISNIEQRILCNSFSVHDSAFIHEIEDCRERASDEEMEDVFELLHIKYASDRKAYISVLSVIYHITGDLRCLEKVEEVIHSGDLGYDMSRGLAWIVDRQRFIKGMSSVDYRHLRKLYRGLTGQLCEMIGYTNDRSVDLAERNSNRIAIVTEQMLSEQHAPSQMTRYLCRFLLQKGYEPRLLILAEGKGTLESCDDIWIDTFRMNYIDGLWGRHEVSFDEDLSVDTTQIAVNSDNIRTLRELIQQLREWKPAYVWSIGDKSCMSELIGKEHPLVSVPCNAGLAVSEAAILVRYMKDRQTGEEDAYAKEMGQQIIDMNWTDPIPEVEPISRSEIGMPEDAFLITVMGNRLDSEIDEEFIAVMQQIISKHEEVYFVLIGDCAIDFGSYGIDDKVCKLGFRADFRSVLECMDLFMNPHRAGGGAGGWEAALRSVPVITMADGDIAAALESDAFFCDSYEDYPNLVDRYITDSIFREHQINECKRLREKNSKACLKEEFRRVDNEIRKRIENTFHGLNT